jgi:hypothetical protein
MKTVWQLFFHFLTTYGINLSNIDLRHEGLYNQKKLIDWHEIVVVSHDEKGRYSFFRYRNKKMITQQQRTSIPNRSLRYSRCA